MRINELISDFRVYVTNEEKKILDKINRPCYIESFDEREQFVIENLIKKSLLVKSSSKGSVVVAPNETN
jgi:hypothetical protein